MNSLEFTIDAGTLTISNGYCLPKFTILVGKNNSGKSRVLKSLYNKIQQGQSPYQAYYISPERFGALQRNSSLEDVGFLNRLSKDKEKLNNQSGDFITDAISNFNGLVAKLNRPPAQSDVLNLFLEYLNNKIPGLNFSYTNSAEDTSFHFKINEKYPNPDIDRFSSGTNQIIALMTSVMYFLHSGKYSNDAILLIDEPDVHIHPDLQFEFIKFLIAVTKETEHKIIIATHSSSIISGFQDEDDSYIATKKDSEMSFTKIEGIVKDLLPSLGTHSLSYVFNKSPLLLIEGDDDYIVWNHAVRKSGGVINFHLVEVGGQDQFKKYEDLIISISAQLYDDPKTFEIRDADVDANGELKTGILDESFIKRSYLNCREIENLILSNEVLNVLGIASWEIAQEKLNTKDEYIGFNRYKSKINKEYELISLLAKNSKSWEQLVGEAIGRNIEDIGRLKDIKGSIYYMLGEKICNWIV